MGLWHNWKWFVHFRKSGQIPVRLIPAVMRTKAVIPLFFVRTHAYQSKRARRASLRRVALQPGQRCHSQRWVPQLRHFRRQNLYALHSALSDIQHNTKTAYQPYPKVDRPFDFMASQKTAHGPYTTVRRARPAKCS